MLGLRFCVRAFSSCVKRGPLFIAVRGPFTVTASLVAEHRLQTRKLSNCGSRAQLLRGMWDLPRPGLEPVSPALAGRLSTTAPPGKPGAFALKQDTTLPPQCSLPPIKYSGTQSEERKGMGDGYSMKVEKEKGKECFSVWLSKRGMSWLTNTTACLWSRCIPVAAPGGKTETERWLSALPVTIPRSAWF